MFEKLFILVLDPDQKTYPNKDKNCGHKNQNDCMETIHSKIIISISVRRDFAETPHNKTKTLIHVPTHTFCMLPTLICHKDNYTYF